MNFVDILFCDDIRQEINNKVSLIGVYNDKLVLSMSMNGVEWPQPINLSTLLRFNLEKNEIKPKQFELLFFLNKKEILKANGDFNVFTNETTQFHIIVNGKGMPIEPGYLGFQINIYSNQKLIFVYEREKALEILIDK